MKNCLIYGSYGYTGDLIARLAVGEGEGPVLAGRDKEKVSAQAKELALDYRVFPLDEPALVDAGLKDIDIVLHCAGPFAHTSAEMVEACFRTGTHYLDITGETKVFEACAYHNVAAKNTGIMLMPGVGFDVVPSDCLAGHLKKRLPSATHLTMAFKGVGGGISHGTAMTMLEGLGESNWIRKDGKLLPVRFGKLRNNIDFGRGPTPCLGIAWGDISSAWVSTGIPNIEIYMAMPKIQVLGAWLSGFLNPILKNEFIKKRVKERISVRPRGPTAKTRARSFILFWGEARDDDSVVRTLMRVPDGYGLTAKTAWDIAKRCLSGEVQAGYQTPAMVFGSDYILRFDGVERSDIVK